MARHPPTEGNDLKPRRVDAGVDITVDGGSVADAAAAFFIDDTEPSDPPDGARWTDTSDAPPRTYVYDGSTNAWIPINAGDRTFVQDTEPDDLLKGDIWFDTSPEDETHMRWFDGSTLRTIQEIPDIPDSVASRPADDGSTTESAKEGLGIETKSDWPSIGARISNNTLGLTTAYLEDTDRNVIETVDVSGLSSGDAFTFDNVNLQENNEYLILGDAEGGDYTLGYVNETDYPYTSTDVDIIGTLANDSLPLETDNQPRVFNDIGNTGFD